MKAFPIKKKNQIPFSLFHILAQILLIKCPENDLRLNFEKFKISSEIEREMLDCEKKFVVVKNVNVIRGDFRYLGMFVPPPS